MKGERIGFLRELNHHRVGRPFVGLILSELQPQAPRLYTHGRVALRIESTRSTEYFSGNLVFLQGYAWMIEGVLG